MKIFTYLPTPRPPSLFSCPSSCALTLRSGPWCLPSCSHLSLLVQTLFFCLDRDFSQFSLLCHLLLLSKLEVIPPVNPVKHWSSLKPSFKNAQCDRVRQSRKFSEGRVVVMNLSLEVELKRQHPWLCSFIVWGHSFTHYFLVAYCTLACIFGTVRIWMIFLVNFGRGIKQTHRQT